MTLKFDNRVAVITGAGGGLGRAYAILLAKLGAKVVVNDLGGSLAGSNSGSQRAADVVVEEIKRSGGTAVANYDSVEQGEKIINTAITTFGRIDILVNNAGVLRDKSLAKMSVKDWDIIMLVHLKGTFLCTKAAWPHMLKQGYGRIVNITSAGGLFGNFGQANYAAAKSAIIGFTKSISAEGSRKNVFVNAVAPIAGTRMTETILPKEIAAALKPEFAAPVVVWLCHDQCKDNGEVIECGAGWVAKLRWQRTKGKFLPKGFGPDDVQREWTTISDFSKDVTYPTNLQESVMMMTQALDATKEEEQQPTKPEEQKQPTKSSSHKTKSDKVFALMGAYLKTGKKGEELVKKLGVKYIWEILDKHRGSVTASWLMDLKTGKGKVEKVKPGTVKDADVTFTIAEADFIPVCLGKENPQILFVQGKLKVKGSMRAASKFTPEIFPKISPEILDLSVDEAIKLYLSTQQSKM